MNNDMTIKQLKKRKAEFENTVLEAVKAFESDTGATITNIDLHTTRVMTGEEEAYNIQIDLKI